MRQRVKAIETTSFRDASFSEKKQKKQKKQSYARNLISSKELVWFYNI